MASKRWDVFVSHASEDKEAFVRPLAIALQSLGVSVWFDEFSLRLGDSLSESIDRGLADSRFGVVVISPDFIRKRWPRRELRGLVARERDEGRIILPIWHQVSRAEVVAFSPPLADVVAVNTRDLDASEIAIQVLHEVRPDLYAASSRARLKRIANGEALSELQEELERVQEELGEYRCPYCGSELVQRIEVEVDDRGDTDSREEFSCGYVAVGGFVERPCPADPKFPSFDDYELHISRANNDSRSPWLCYAIGKTPMAQRLSLGIQHGATKEEAEQRIREQYIRYAKRS